MLEFKNLSIQRGKKVLLDDTSVRIERGYRVGLIGRNGAGKSSLMQILIGQAQEDGGSIQCDVKKEYIAHLEQSLPHSDESAINYVKRGDREWYEVQQQLIQAEAADDGHTIAACHARLQEIDGYSIDSRAAIILHGLGFSNEEMQQSVRDFSGGWQMRLQLAKVLLSRADLLLLDEPTNHLDLEAIAWFEQWLLEQTCSIILISHDRDFLDNVCTCILHLAQKQLKLYQGNYTSFTEQFQLQMELEGRQRDKVDKQRAHMQKFVDRFRYKASKARQAQSRMKAIEKLTISPGLQEENPFHFSFLPCEELGNPIFKLEGDAGYPGNCVLKYVDLTLSSEDRIGLLGLNGAGKSTLIKTMAADLPLLSGELTRHNKLNIGYFSQQQVECLEYDSTPLAHMIKQNPGITETEARKFLGGFNMSGDRVFDKVGNFSGGEKARLALALLVYKAPNMLLLDEPTNHLDIQMREALILALHNYSGAVILVSHDRYFVNSVVEGLWLVAKGGVSEFTGNLDDYQRMVLAGEVQKQSSPSPKSKPSVVTPKAAALNSQQLKKLETEIAGLEKKKKLLLARLADTDLYQEKNKEKLQQLQTEYQHVESTLEKLEADWLRQTE